MATKKRHRKSIIVRLLVLGVSVYMVVTLATLWKTLQESRMKYNELSNEYQSKQAAIEELKQMLNEDNQAAIIEKAARERLGYVYSDEEIYIDISGN